MLQSLLWDDEVREADFPSLDEDVRVSARRLRWRPLVENMSTDFAPEKFSDDYQEQLRELIAAKLEQGDALDTAATFGDEDEAGRGRPGGRPDGGAAAQRGGEPGEADGAGRRSRPAKKTPAKKSCREEEGRRAKKTAAKKESSPPKGGATGTA